MTTQMVEEPDIGLKQAEDDPLLSRVLGYENKDVIARIAKEAKCSQEVAEALFQDTLRFLYLCGTQDGSWGPTERIDIGWHAFVLFTRDYAQFCEDMFGRFIHHNPNRIGAKPDRQRPCRTMTAAIQLFGRENLPANNWTYLDSEGKEFLTPESDVRTVSLDGAQAMCGNSCGCSPCD